MGASRKFDSLARPSWASGFGRIPFVASQAAQVGRKRFPKRTLFAVAKRGAECLSYGFGSSTIWDQIRPNGTKFECFFYFFG